MNLTQKVLIGLMAGLFLGLTLNATGLSVSGGFVDTYLSEGIFALGGKLFVNALKMLVVPLVFFSIVCGVLGIGDIKLLGRVGSKSFGLYMSTTAIAIATALIAATIFSVGSGIEPPPTDSDFSGKNAPSLVQVITDIVPSNPIAAMAEGNMLAIIFYALIFGICLLSIKDKAPVVIQFAEQMNELMMKMVEIVMHFAPYAVFCLIAKVMAQLGFDLFVELIFYVLVLAGVLLFHGFVTLPSALKAISGLNPRIFLKKIRSAQMFAFSTASSGATIPATLQAVENRMGVKGSVASFTVPFGATINMDGTAMMQGVATVFIANVYGLDLALTDYLLIVLMSILASIGTAGVPGVGLIMLTMVFTQVNLPVEGIALIIGVDRLMDMIRTSVNITGDAAVSCVVAKSENDELDMDVFNDPHSGVLEEHVTQ
ncbi:dicarboxylate/amino acid:cation symporter [Sessilibacter corallicola]|uniref:dicarboxylate/amino acid:cation symporter n=1 Tax=Sessilibacter corallicola TaxID=2904075 RepID=UPI001E61DB9F|nr:dicarboxylate/amino acid:cation symporter [Sessilibacter corallicola]MCE2028290.1 dicarboxylate/amino acid:cation symporter [Sessilibacter corallicola]